MIPLIASICFLFLLASLLFLLRDFAGFIYHTSFKQERPGGFIDWGEYGLTWFATFMIASSAFIFYKFGIIAFAYLVSKDLISFFMIARGIFTFNNELQHPFVWQNFISGMLIVPAFQFLAAVGLFRSIQYFMSFLNQKYGRVIYDEKDLFYHGFVASLLFIAFEILFYSQDISLVSGIAHLSYLAVSKLAIICSFLTVCHLHLLKAEEYKSELSTYVTFNRREAAVIYTPWKVVIITYLLSMILQIPFVTGTQFIGSNMTILLIYFIVCAFFYVVLKYFLANVYNSLGTTMLIESAPFIDREPGSRSMVINQLFTGVFCFAFLSLLVVRPKVILSLFFLSFGVLLLFTLVHLGVYSLLFGASLLRSRLQSVHVPIIQHAPVVSYLGATLSAIVMSVLPMAGFVFCTLTALSIFPKQHRSVDQYFINSIFDETGRPLFVENFDGNGSIPIPYEQLPTFLLKCLYLQEDRDFTRQDSWAPNWSNWHGFSPATVYRVLGGNGGSNLNMQLIKNLAFPQTPPIDFQRKFIESIAAFQLSLQYTPQQIVTQYLNVVGINGAVKHRGLMAASLYTFGRPVSQLNSLEMLYLIATLKRGQHFKLNDGFVKYDQTGDKANAIKEKLVSQAKVWKQKNLLTAKDLRALKSQELRFVNHVYSAKLSGPANKFFGNQLIRSGLSGNTFQSSMSIAAQESMQTAIQEFKLRFHSQLLQGKHRLYFGALVADVKTGRILAHYGGENGPELTQFLAGYPVASLIKPFLAIELLETGFPMTTTLYDGPVPGRTTPQNASRVYSFKHLGINEILGRSLNAPMVNIRQITPPIPLFKRTENSLRRMGVPDDPSLALDDKTRAIEYELNYPLGSRRMTLFQITQIYQTLLNGGRYEKLTGITATYDPIRDCINQFPGGSKRIYTQANADLIKLALHQTVEPNGTGHKLTTLVHTERKLFAKTGTSDQAKQGYTVLSDGEKLIVTFVSYGIEKDNRLDMNTPLTIPGGSGSGSAGVLAALIYNNLPLQPYSILNATRALGAKLSGY